MNPVSNGDGLRLNIHGSDNALDIELAREAAALFRVKKTRREEIIGVVRGAVKRWPVVARKYGLSKTKQNRMARAFRAIES